MGIYTSGGLYFGRLLSQATRDRITDKMLEDFNMELHDLKDPRGRYVLHPPGCFIPNYYLNEERKIKLIVDASIYKEKLIELVKLLSKDQSDIVGFYKVSFEFTTYALELSDETRVKSNIRFEVENNTDLVTHFKLNDL